MWLLHIKVGLEVPGRKDPEHFTQSLVCSDQCPHPIPIMNSNTEPWKLDPPGCSCPASGLQLNETKIIMLHFSTFDAVFTRSVLGISLLLGCLMTPNLALAERSPMDAFRDLSEVKAECQRVAKLHVERILVAESSRASRRMDRALSELNTYVKYSADWAALTKQSTAQLSADIRAVETLAAKASRDRNSIPEMVQLADRCTGDAEAQLNQLPSVGAGSKAVAVTGRALYLTQQAVRDYLVMNAGVKIAGISFDEMTKKRAEIDELFKQLEKLPSNTGMRSALGLTHNQWIILKPMLTNRKATTAENQDMAMRSSERMFEALDELFDEVQAAAAAFN